MFLLDVSGSMQPPNKLPLVKQAFRLLVHELRRRTGWPSSSTPARPGWCCPPTPGSDKATILEALDRLQAGGSTAGGAGHPARLRRRPAQHYEQEGNNRVILATDGDFNVGESSDAAMVRLIEERREQGIFLTVLGFGTGQPEGQTDGADRRQGQRHYAYVDTLHEARKVFVERVRAARWSRSRRT